MNQGRQSYCWRACLHDARVEVAATRDRYELNRPGWQATYEAFVRRAFTARTDFRVVVSVLVVLHESAEVCAVVDGLEGCLETWCRSFCISLEYRARKVCAEPYLRR